MSDPTTYDVAVVGAGHRGLRDRPRARRHDLSVTLVEARDDVGDGTSKANTAILHTGFDATPGTLESRLVARGYDLLGDYAEQTGIPVERTGAMLVAWTDEQLDALPGADGQGGAQRLPPAARSIDADEVYRAGARTSAPARWAGCTVPGESIICTWTTNLALATDAVNRGAALLRGHRVDGVDAGAGRTRCTTTGGDVTARWVINAAGLGADIVDAAVRPRPVHGHPAPR